MSTDASEDPFRKLSDDILLKIFNNLSHCDLISVRNVCKRFETVSKDRTLVRHIDMSACYNLPKTALIKYLRPVANHVQSLNLNGCYWLSSQCCDIIMRCRNLVSLHMLHLSINIPRLIALLAHLKHLQHLSMTLINLRQFQSLLDSNPEAQATMQGVRVLTIRIKPRYMRASQMIMQFVAVTSFFEYCSSLEEFHMQGAYHCNGIPPEVVSPQIKHLENLRHIHTMTVTDTTDAIARMFFFAALLEVARLTEIRFRTLLMPLVVCRYLSLQSNYVTCIHQIEELQHLDISYSNTPIPNQVHQFERAQQLRYLNVGENAAINCDSLQVLADSCPHLTSINLRNCHHLHQKHVRGDIFEVDMSGLQALVMNCTALKHINLSGVHIHGKDLDSTSYSSICRLLALNSNWRSLSLSPCCLCPGSRSDDDNIHQRKRIAQSSSDFNHPAKRQRKGLQAPDVNVDKEVELNTELGSLVKACPHVEHLELIGASFRSTFSKRYIGECNMQPSTSCVTGMKMDEGDLMCIRHWKHLHTLQLSGVPAIQRGDCLAAVLRECPRLERLLLAQLCNTPVPHYQQALLSALPSAHRLSDLRIEQRHFQLRDSLWLALSRMPSLRRLCILGKHSTFNPAHVLNFVQQVPSLVLIQLFVSEEMTLKACSQLQTNLVTTFSGQRPALSVCVFPLMKIDQPPLHMIPDVHLENMTILSSTVCLTPPDQHSS